ncbi:hypothetical protein [Sphingobacterium micropteri]|uniref:hypothetical protein n=1 Tax=Sphingobacterium micropteri TaxID=2763501 RepID=UPI001CC2EB8E|nr:hypothetical protein [Sphingobacterium micropteri]
MDIRYISLLKNVREITDDDYDPKEKIQAFWEKYGVNHSRLHVLNMCLIYGGEQNVQEGLSKEDMEIFSYELMTLLMAYHVAHHEKLNLEDIKIPIEEAPKKSPEEKFFSDILYTMLGLRHFEQKLEP